MALKKSFIDEIMNEPIRMPGFPALIVTRAEARAWFRRAGWNLDQRTEEGQSVDRMVFLPASVDEPLSDVDYRDHIFAELKRLEGRS